MRQRAPPLATGSNGHVQRCCATPSPSASDSPPPRQPASRGTGGDRGEERTNEAQVRRTRRRSSRSPRLGSHSALQILKGAKDEGFHTLAVVTPLNERLYSSFAFVDEVIVIPRYGDFPKLEQDLNRRKVILVPHGSFVAYLSMEEHKRMTTPYFGNKAVLDWEADRMRQREWLTKAGLKMPRQFTKASEIDRPVIVKLYGAHGGKGYLFVKNPEDFTARASHLVEQRYIMQEYVLGVPVYIHYFYSPLTGKLEIMSMDRRYESNVDSLGRIPLADQEGWDISPSYVVIGNQPISLRESLLAEAFDMGEAVVRVSREICSRSRSVWRVLPGDHRDARVRILPYGDLRAHRCGYQPFH